VTVKKTKWSGQTCPTVDDFYWFDVHESVHHAMIVKVTNKMQLYRLIY